MDESKLELKVGLLVAAAIGGVVALLALMGELHLSRGAVLKVNFAHTGNVVKNAPVKLAGVTVGRVDDIELLPSRHDDAHRLVPVRMTLSVRPDVAQALTAAAEVTVSTQGPLGEAYLELWPGTSPQPFDLTAEIRGTDAPRLDVVSNRLAQFLESASGVLESDPEALGKLLRGVGGLSTSLEGVVTENRDNVRELASELKSALHEVRQLAAHATAQLEPNGRATALLDDSAAVARLARHDLPALSQRASVALGGIAALSGPLTEEDGQRLKSTLAHVQQASERLESLSTRADALLIKLESGDGTLGAFMKDKQAYDDLKSLLADLRKHPWKMLWKE